MTISEIQGCSHGRLHFSAIMKLEAVMFCCMLGMEERNYAPFFMRNQMTQLGSLSKPSVTHRPSHTTQNLGMSEMFGNLKVNIYTKLKQAAQLFYISPSLRHWHSPRPTHCKHCLKNLKGLFS